MPDTNKYLDYLSEEMTIMGILSGVCLALPAGILGTAIAKDSDIGGHFWAKEQLFIVAGSVLCIFASAFFYKQRSTLAWYYGQICLAGALAGDGSHVSPELRDWLTNADSWATWWPYSWGFTALWGGVVEYVVGVCYFVGQTRSPNHYHPGSKPWIFIACPVLIVLISTIQWYVLTTYHDEDNPWKSFIDDPLRRFRKSSLPTDNVFTRLKPSPLHGVGVFAIIRIPKGTYVFEPDDAALTEVPSNKLKTLPEALQEIYVDFAPFDRGKYLCPSSFNEMTPAWYLNRSESPNIAADTSLKFYAIRDIEAGEELTANYSEYSDEPTAFTPPSFAPPAPAA